MKAALDSLINNLSDKICKRKYKNCINEKIVQNVKCVKIIL